MPQIEKPDDLQSIANLIRFFSYCDIHVSVFRNFDYDSFTIRFIDCDIMNCLVK